MAVFPEGQFPPVSSASLSAGEVHLWFLDMEGCADDAERLWRLLDEAEQLRAKRFRQEALKQRFVIGQGALRWLLGSYLDIAPESVRFIRGQKGKPRLLGTEPDQGLVFNVSHSDNLALFAIGRDVLLGVDVEAWRSMRDMEGMAARCFSPEEQAYWLGLPENARLAAFFDFWTCKEAFVKAVGVGIALGLDRCIIDWKNGPRVAAVPDGCGRPDEWRLIDINFGEGASAALCTRGPITQVRMGNLTGALAWPKKPRKFSEI